MLRISRARFLVLALVLALPLGCDSPTDPIPAPRIDLTSDIGGMDDVSMGNLVALERAAQRVIRANDYGLREFAKMLSLDEVPA